MPDSAALAHHELPLLADDDAQLGRGAGDARRVGVRAVLDGVVVPGGRARRRLGGQVNEAALRAKAGGDAKAFRIAVDRADARNEVANEFCRNRKLSDRLEPALTGLRDATDADVGRGTVAEYAQGVGRARDRVNL